MPRTYLTAQQTADRLGVKLQTLAIWRLKGKGPAFKKLGRLIAYDADEVDAWVEQMTHRSTSEYRLKKSAN